MENFWKSITIEILGGFAFLAFLIPLGLLYSKWRNNRLQFFFGVTGENRLKIIISQIFIPHPSQITTSLPQQLQPLTFGVDGQPRSYYGVAVPFGEVDIAANYKLLFQQAIEGVSDLPGAFRSLTHTDVNVEIAHSSFIQDFVPPPIAFVSLGSPGYNAGSDWIQKQLKPRIKFDMSNNLIQVEPQGGTLYTTSSPNHCFACRLMRDTGIPVFYAGGPNETATVCGAMFLLREWKYIRNRGANARNICFLIQFDLANPKNYASIECVKYD